MKREHHPPNLYERPIPGLTPRMLAWTLSAFASLLVTVMTTYLNMRHELEEQAVTIGSLQKSIDAQATRQAELETQAQLIQLRMVRVETKSSMDNKVSFSLTNKEDNALEINKPGW